MSKMNRDDYPIKMRGKKFRVKFLKIPDKHKADGLCDSPATPAKEIWVHNDLPPLRELEVLLHECLHAGMWDASEEAVQQVAEGLADAVWRRGFRKIHE